MSDGRRVCEVQVLLWRVLCALLMLPVAGRGSGRRIAPGGKAPAAARPGGTARQWAKAPPAIVGLCYVPDGPSANHPSPRPSWAGAGAQAWSSHPAAVTAWPGRVFVGLRPPRSSTRWLPAGGLRPGLARSAWMGRPLSPVGLRVGPAVVAVCPAGVGCTDATRRAVGGCSVGGSFMVITLVERAGDARPEKAPGQATRPGRGASTAPTVRGSG
jgi:hypothetical protein